MRSNRRTSLRTATVLAGAAAVLALPVGAAFADSPTGPSAEPEVLPGVEQPAVEPSVKPSVEPSVEPSVKPSAKPSAGVRAYVTSVKLADGSVAKVYKIGDGHFEADVFSGDTKLDTLVSKDGKPAYGQNNGLHVVLQPNGTVTSWVEGGNREPVEKPKPKPEVKPEVKKEVKKEASVRITMPDGRIATLVDGAKGKRAEISLPNGHALGTIDLKNPSVVNDGWTYKLVQDGKRVKFVVIDGKGGGDSWVYDFSTGKLIEKYRAEKDAAAKPTTAPGGKTERVVPKGGVKAGAEGVGAPQADTPVLLAAGGGMAAMGAAGLGFAILRRGRRS
ncbi:PT domain-containing protein [Streptomyces sp. NBC_00249]|uniref:PT domain-containing protein n=1 Tax=Streptomyces sp. NBC_00249 TaxID=2975690 RepID=UPI00224DA8A1|nr:PT domain-containing protein [Streptomyces sp. NBC_00249]MCX5196064.1 PT domain-containing protein [Streptomyces sp. NBC_00249]